MEFSWTIEKSRIPATTTTSRVVQSDNFYYTRREFYSEWKLVLTLPKPGLSGLVSVLFLMSSNFTEIEIEGEIWISKTPGEKTLSRTLRREFFFLSNEGRCDYILIPQVSDYLNGDNLETHCNFKVTRFSGRFLEHIPKIFLGNGSSSFPFWKLYTEQKLTDVTLKVGPKEFKVHKVVLAANSPVFAAMFEHNMTENLENCVIMTDTDPNTVERFIESMYKGGYLATPAPSQKEFEQKLANLLAIVEKYDVKPLKTACEIRLCWSVRKENAASIALLADMYNAELLKEFVLQYIKTKITDVMASEGWNSLLRSPDLMHDVVSSLVNPPKRPRLSTDPSNRETGPN